MRFDNDPLKQTSFPTGLLFVNYPCMKIIFFFIWSLYFPLLLVFFLFDVYIWSLCISS